jgi:anthranilate synthase/aminodeoxychorismate synthase-like glutamine amidotransferase
VTSSAELRIVIVDNYDSYTYNLYQALGELTGQEARVVRHDAIDLERLRALAPTHLVLSPGPGDPSRPEVLGVGWEAISKLGPTVPLLGVCLGHQGIGAALGGSVVRAPQPRHGKVSLVEHDGSRLFDGIPSPFAAMRYHSLVLDEQTLPETLRVTARTTDGVVMAIAHTAWPVVGVQFHPESIGTPDGLRLLGNFLRHGSGSGAAGAGATIACGGLDEGARA